MDENGFLFVNKIMFFLDFAGKIINTWKKNKDISIIICSAGLKGFYRNKRDYSIEVKETNEVIVKRL